MTNTIIVLTATKNNISYLAKYIYDFITKQTKSYDMFYLMISSDTIDDINKLPLELLKIIKYFNIIIKTIDDTPTFIKYYICPLHYNDTVIFIDYDNIYENNFIEKIIENTNYNNLIINSSNKKTYISDYNVIMADYVLNETNITKYNNGFIFYKESFPLNALKYKEIRKKYCDNINVWLNIFINTSYKQVKTLNNLNIDIKDDESDKLVYNIINKYDFLQYILLRILPGYLEKWKNKYKTYNSKEFDNIPIDILYNIYKSY